MYYVTYPKSRKGVRKIPMLKEVREVFEELYRRRNDFNKDYQPVIDGYTNFIFRDLHGKLMNSKRINRIYPLGPFDDKGRLKPVLTKSHSFASDLYELI